MTDENNVSDEELLREVDLKHINKPKKRASKPKRKGLEDNEVVPFIPNEQELSDIRVRANVVTQELKKLHDSIQISPDEQVVFSFEESHEALITDEFLNGYHVRRKYHNENDTAGYECSGKKIMSKVGIEPCPYKATFRLKTLSTGAKTIMIDKMVELNHPPNLEVPYQQRKHLGGSQSNAVDIIVYPCLLSQQQKEYLIRFYKTLPSIFASYTMEQSLMAYFNWSLNDSHARKSFST